MDINSRDLDNYITGHYGEDQFEGDNNMIRWQDVPMFHLDDSQPLTDSERIEALREYRMDNSIIGVVLTDPTEWDEDEDGDISEAGPDVDEIDWTGFPE